MKILLMSLLLSLSAMLGLRWYEQYLGGVEAQNKVILSKIYDRAYKDGVSETMRQLMWSCERMHGFGVTSRDGVSKKYSCSLARSL